MKDYTELAPVLQRAGEALIKAGRAISEAMEPKAPPTTEDDLQWVASLPAWPSGATDVEAISNANQSIADLTRWIKRFPYDATAVLKGVDRNLARAISRRDAEDAARLLYIKSRLSKIVSAFGESI